MCQISGEVGTMSGRPRFRVFGRLAGGSDFTDIWLSTSFCSVRESILACDICRNGRKVDLVAISDHGRQGK